MPLIEIHTDTVDHHCATCGATNAVAFTSMSLGSDQQMGEGNGQVISLPACPNCGSREFLCRSPKGSSEYETHPDQGGYGHLHRILVDTLHGKLMDIGQGPPGVVSSWFGEPKPPQSLLDQWFPDGLRVPIFEHSEPGSGGQQ